MNNMMAQFKVDQGNNMKYKVEASYNNAFYTSKLKSHLPRLYYLV